MTELSALKNRDMLLTLAIAPSDLAAFFPSIPTLPTHCCGSRMFARAGAVGLCRIRAGHDDGL